MNQEIQVLLVEDNASDAEMTIRALDKNNLANRLLWLKDGAAALDFLFGEGEYATRSAEDKPKVVILDLKMPKVSGREVLQKMRADPRTKTIPVVVLSSSKEDPDINECYAMGANSYVVKPVDFDDFHRAISNLGLYWMIVNERG